METVSVVIPTYGSPRFLLESVNSVIASYVKVLEIVVVDDNDGRSDFFGLARKKLSAYRDIPIKFIEPGFNSGVASARNQGWRASQGEYVYFLDADDILLPCGLTFLLSGFNDDVGLVYGGHVTFGETASEVTKIPGLVSRKDLCTNVIGPPASVLTRRAVLEAVSGFDTNFKYRDDLDFYYRVSKQYLLAVVSNPVCKYRLHQSSLSQNKKRVLNDLNYFIEKYQFEMCQFENCGYKLLYHYVHIALQSNDVDAVRFGCRRIIVTPGVPKVRSFLVLIVSFLNLKVIEFGHSLQKYLY